MIAAVVLAAVTLASPTPGRVILGGDSPMSVICDMILQPDEHGDVYMKFKLANYSNVAVDRIWLRVFEPDLTGYETGAPAIDELDGRIAANGTVTRGEDVKAPPGFRMLKFSSLDCTITAVHFVDGTTWQALGNRNPH
ncbi:MAG TPA: hypothetical protein VKR05_00390 [Candidatus Cybelea sp.]|nr:hypothetical protein [Candidatus Cybelea sp.]